MSGYVFEKEQRGVFRIAHTPYADKDNIDALALCACRGFGTRSQWLTRANPTFLL